MVTCSKESKQDFKWLRIIIAFVFVLSFFNPKTVDASIGIGTDIGDILETNIVTYINGHYIPSYNVDGYTVVMCHELDNYGFNTSYDSATRIVRISYNKNKPVNTESMKKPDKNNGVSGKKIGDVLYTDIETYIDNRKIPSFNINGYTAILTQDLAAFGEVTWDPDNRIVNVYARENYAGDVGVRLNKNHIANNYFDNTQYVIVEHVYYNLETKRYEVEESREYISAYPTYGGNRSKGYTTNTSPREYPTKILLGTVVKGIDRYVTVGQTQQMINSTYERDLKYFKSPTVLNVALKLQEINPTKYKSLADEFAKNKYVPLKITDANISYNSIGIPEANLTFKNLTAKQIRAIEISFRCYDDFGRPVYRFLDNQNIFYGIAQGLTLDSRESETYTWTLNLYDHTTNIKYISIDGVAYSDGTTWSR